ncbi:MAG: photosynthetic reaction center subunit [Pseudomonadota bacterium]|jgi:photosynthetic reaction center H subunit
MGTGAITGYLDVAQVLLYVFWVFFAGLIYYLQRESKREGFPLESTNMRGDTVESTGVFDMPPQKTFHLANGHSVTVPNDKRSAQPLNAIPAHHWAGSPLVPTGDPLLAGVGPGAWADRADVPETDYEGHPKIVPLRARSGYSVAQGDPDPHGMNLIGADGKVAGKVTELWLDHSEMMFRYLEASVSTPSGSRSVLVPVAFSDIGRKDVKVNALTAQQFAQVPGIKQADQVTMLEEEKITAYFGAGTLYAEPHRQEPLI